MQFILFLQMAIQNYKNFSKSFISKFSMIKGKCNVYPVHAMQGEWRFSSIEAKAALTQQSIPAFVYWTYISRHVFLDFCLHTDFLFTVRLL